MFYYPPISNLLFQVTYFYQSVKEKNRRLPKSGEVLDIFLMLAEFQHPEVSI